MRTRHLVVLLSVLAYVAPAQRPVNQSSQTLQDFEKQIANYVKMRKTWTKGVPPLKAGSSPELLQKYNTDICAKIRSGRSGAQQGEFFTPAVKAEFQRLIGLTMAGRDGVKVRKGLATDEPAVLKLRVNDSYPSSEPLQTAPPTLLLNLPKLPPELEYRVVSKNLILRDVDANLIVDYMTDVIR